jgi:CheY-like chemotaxis protein
VLEANRNLQQQITQRQQIAQALRDARDAEAANRSKDKYLAAASHDLLQPLNAARLLISTLRERKLPEVEQVLVEHPPGTGRRRRPADRPARHFQARSVGGQARRRRLPPRRTARAAGVGISVSRRGGRVESACAHRPLRHQYRLAPDDRILRNFLSNACRYTDEGCILLGARRRGEMLRLEVWDTGRGIAADRLDSIFLEFNQLDVGRAADRKGWAWGWPSSSASPRSSATKSACIRCRGAARCSASMCRFAPRCRCPSAWPPQARTGNPLPGRRLLVLDNEVSILQSMSALLGQWGCEVVTATDEASAIDALRGQAPELILADYHLDHAVVGCDVVRHLREHFHQTIPAVIITADRTDQCRRALQRLDAPLLNKPVKPGKLRAVLSRCWVRALDSAG